MLQRYFLPVLSLVVLAVLCACGASTQLKSPWRQAAVNIDGETSDWEGRLQSVEDARMSIAATNDGERLYLCLVSANSDVQRQVISRGLILWFNTEGKKEKSFGVRYPHNDFLDMAPDKDFQERGEIASKEDHRQQLELKLNESKDRVRFLSSEDGEGWTMVREEFKGVELDIMFDGPRLVYEVSLPLHSGEGQPYALNTGDANKIMIGVETPEFERENMKGHRRGMGMGANSGMGGGPGGSGGGRGGMGGGQGGSRPQMPEEIDTWIEVALSPAP